MNRMPIKGMMLAAVTLVGIAVSEGYKGEAYIPVPGDVPTIGFGHTEGVRMGDKTTPVRSLVELMGEVDDVYATGVKKCVTVPLYQHEFDAYVRLAYNIGVGAFCRKAKEDKPPNLIDLINAERYEEACDRILAFNKSGGKVYTGLVKRRKEEQQICRGEDV